MTGGSACDRWVCVQVGQCMAGGSVYGQVRQDMECRSVCDRWVRTWNLGRCMTVGSECGSVCHRWVRRMEPGSVYDRWVKMWNVGRCVTRGSGYRMWVGVTGGLGYGM